MTQATVTTPDAIAVSAGLRGVLEAFRQAPATHAPIPFYWWAGERLDRGRIAWQLDQLHRGGIRQVVISYPHGPDGGSSLGDPELFSPEWWDLFRWFLAACRERGMSAGFQDYTLVEPILRGIGERTPDMRGGRLVCEARHARGGEKVRLTLAAGTHPVTARAYPLRDGLPRVEESRSLDDRVTAEGLEWEAPAGEWWVAWVAVEAAPFDPLHPDSGRLALDALYAPFERECPGEVGETLRLFFQDELDFGSRMPFWSAHLPAAFSERQGYDLLPWLPALWHDLGRRTEKVRMDYAEVVVGRLEECYFEPVFRWHEERGTMFGHDNCGRGRIGEGRSFYGDYFRTMRWFSAPGCDDPKLQGARSFRGLKVNSSIATLYRRPRVWVEAFHSSGWGTTPAEVVSALYEDLAYGANVVNLHGLYYSTCGGWWEWAPPDFHFRQPYWMHAAGLNTCLTRLCWLLSQGVHRCDVAMLYPVAALHAMAENSGAPGTEAHMGNEAIGTAPATDEAKPEDSAFGIGRHLFDRGCDFDFVDDLSLAGAAATDGELRAGPGRYRALVLPAMRAITFATLEKARDFAKEYTLKWFRRVKQFVDDYDPDMLYTDGTEPFTGGGTAKGVISDATVKAVAHMYNKRAAKNGGPVDCMAVIKGGPHIPGIAAPHENGYTGPIKRDPWVWENTLGEWFFEDNTLYDSRSMIFQMIEAISRDGNFNLNIGLTPEGELEPGGVKMWQDFGEFTRRNAAAIYGSSAWKLIGEDAAGATDSRSADVGAQVRALVADKRLDLIVSTQALGGDPAPGVPKVLVVKYQLHGKPGTITRAEGERLLIAGNGPLEILDARFGPAAGAAIPRAFPSGPIVREHADFAMATSDIRFTQGKDGAVYAFVMAVPKAGETLRVRSLGKTAAFLERPISKVAILGVDAAPEWRQRDEALEVVYRSNAALPFAIVLRVE